MDIQKTQFAICIDNTDYKASLIVPKTDDPVRLKVSGTFFEMFPASHREEQDRRLVDCEKDPGRLLTLEDLRKRIDD